MNREDKEKILKLDYKCATKKEYREWLEAARLSRPPLSSWFCTDCTPSFQHEMIMKRLCVRPNIKFRISTTEGIEGYCP